MSGEPNLPFFLLMGISRDSLRERIKKILLERIMDGHYPPDFQLKEVSLAEEFGTSPVPVREALRELSAMRILDSQSYKGVHVRSFTNAEIRDGLRGSRCSRGIWRNACRPLFQEQCPTIEALPGTNTESHWRDEPASRWKWSRHCVACGVRIGSASKSVHRQ